MTCGHYLPVFEDDQKPGWHLSFPSVIDPRRTPIFRESRSRDPSEQAHLPARHAFRHLTCAESCLDPVRDRVSVEVMGQRRAARTIVFSSSAARSECVPEAGPHIRQQGHNGGSAVDYGRQRQGRHACEYLQQWFFVDWLLFVLVARVPHVFED
jgi:hypothetical protein